MMLQRRILYRWLLTAWLMLCGSLVSFAVTYDRVSQTSLWGYQPAYNTGTVSTARVASLSAQPSYEFKSTSSYQSVVGSSVFLSSDSYSPVGNTRPGSIRRGGTGNPWDDEPGDDDDPIGQKPTQPIGEPWILILIALLYIVGKQWALRLRTKK